MMYCKGFENNKFVWLWTFRWHYQSYCWFHRLRTMLRNGNIFTIYSCHVTFVAYWELFIKYLILSQNELFFSRQIKIMTVLYVYQSNCNKLRMFSSSFLYYFQFFNMHTVVNNVLVNVYICYSKYLKSFCKS